MARAVRKCFIVSENNILEKEFEFEFFNGFSLSQKQKSINAFHEQIKKIYPNKSILEVSTKSNNEYGYKLSSFNINCITKEGTFPLECVFQSSKVFQKRSNLLDNKLYQFKELLYINPRDVKKSLAKKLFENNLIPNDIVEFNHDNKKYPLNPKSFFYDYIYCKSISKSNEDYSFIGKFDIFTDIEFNHNKSISTQARTSAILSFLIRNNKVYEYLSNIDKFIEVYKFIIEDSTK